MRLLTLGCSWVYGVGAQYDSENPLTEEEYKRTCQHVHYHENTWRNLLSQEFQLENVNLSRGGSSNRSQFRRATKYFRKDRGEDVVVLWGITAVCREELWMNDTNRYSSFNFGGTVEPKLWKKDMKLKHKVPYTFLKNHYNEKAYQEELVNNVLHWQEYFTLKKIPFGFFETINTTGLVSNTVLKKDLLSTLTDVTGGVSENDRFHFSKWKRDCNRIGYLTKKDMVNPYSHHPTKQGHVSIFEFMKPVLEKIMAT